MSEKSITMRATLIEEARMRGDGIEPQPHMWSYMPLEQRIPADHPLRPLRAMVDRVLQELSPQFDELYSKVGRPSIPPEHLLRALLLQVLYSVRSERLLMEQLDYNLLFRWFVAWPWTTGSGTPRCLPRTGNGCSAATSRGRFLNACAPKPSSGDFCPTSTSPSMAR
jgi:hypothetical protein